MFHRPLTDSELYCIESAAHDMNDAQTQRLVTEIRRLRAILVYPVRRRINWNDEYLA